MNVREMAIRLSDAAEHGDDDHIRRVTALVSAFALVGIYEQMQETTRITREAQKASLAPLASMEQAAKATRTPPADDTLDDEHAEAFI